MGLFTTADNPAGVSSEIAIISEGLSITGEINATDNVYINGTFKGRIVAKGEVSIGPKGKVDGEILTKSLQVSGLLEGNIECESITIFPTGRVIGNLCSYTLEVYPGGYLFGENRVRIPQAAPTPATQENEPKAAPVATVTPLPAPKESDKPATVTEKKHEHVLREKPNTVSSIAPVTDKAENKIRPQATSDSDQVVAPIPKDVSEPRRWHSHWGRK